MADGLSLITWLALIVPMPLCVIAAVITWWLDR